MGMSKSKKKTTNEPPAWAKDAILKGIGQTTRVFDRQQPLLEKFSDEQMAAYSRLSPGAERGIMGAQNVINSTLNGDNLNGNPYLDGIRGSRNESIINNTNSQFTNAGRYGSGNHGQQIAREIARSDNELLYNNYSQERQNQLGAVGQAQSLMGGSQSLLNNAAELPWMGVNALNGGVRQASNGYGTTRETSTGAWGPMLLNAAASAAQAASMSDRRAKTNIVKVREDADGLGWYDFDYLPGLGQSAQRQHGVMADEVATLRPHALGPVMGGYATVNYGAL